MDFAVVDIAGHQEKVSKGQTLSVPLLGTEQGKTVTFDKVLLFSSEKGTKVGSPYVSGVQVDAKVISHGKAQKFKVFTMKKRKRNRRTIGCRPRVTEIEITKISG